MPFAETSLVRIWSNVAYDGSKRQTRGEEGDSEGSTGYLPQVFSDSSLSDAEALKVIRG